MTDSRSPLSQQAREIRRHAVMELLSTGYTNHREIADKLNTGIRTIDRDVRYWNEVSNKKKKTHFENLPLEIEKCIAGVELTIRQLTEIINQQTDTDDQGVRLEAMRDRMQAYRFKMEILDGKARLDEVFTFIDQQQKKEQNPSRGLTHQNKEVAIDDSPISEHL